MHHAGFSVFGLARAQWPAVLAAAVLAACGGGDESSSPTASASPSASPHAAVPLARSAGPLASPAATTPTVLPPTTFSLTTPDRVTVGSIVLNGMRYNDVVVTWGQLLAGGLDAPRTSYNSFDPGTFRATLPKVQVGDTTYTNIVISVTGLVSVGSAAPVGPMIPNDPLFGDQWHLLNTGQAGPNGTPGLAGEDLRTTMAWNYVTGTGIRIAVVDDGLDITHEDFKVVPGKSWDYRVDAYGDPSSATGSHGTSCGALAAAQGQNGIGVTGVAFNASVVGYNLLAANIDQFGAGAVVKDLADNHIYTNSYGAPDGTGQAFASGQAWRDAIDTGTTSGRGGKGVIYTWAAGNGAPSDRSDHDGQANYQGVFAIGSLNDQGKRSSYSEPGSNILVMGYGGESCDTHTMTSADIMGAAGYNNGATSQNAEPYTDYQGQPNYTRCINGTSSATPEVAGITALLLEMNPALGWRDVRAILARTARKNDPTSPGWVTNGGGLGVNHEYGFGAADATAAVAAAGTWVNLPAQKTATAAQAAPALIGSTATPLVSTVALGGSGISKLEFVDVTVDANLPDFGTADITLTSPSGTVSTLTTPHQCRDLSDSSNPKTVACGNSLQGGFRFGVVRLMDEPADGTWTLRVGDQASGSTLTAWSIKAYGH
ncbi:S8 family serine peptidase [Caenimonas koreensis DSM 17982]|uniref:S8 family serine peptidase n=1 Tax=Caenimonas koreensis DSM 17982 TaxID=1121255 RepID=A0A844B2E5_9BURK|nr:S8 family serine peptidase [Caenimonas koreensis]MRD48908.1 S8 family serine peptidase [Caenimonas koreensis DSM 17982]